MAYRRLGIVSDILPRRDVVDGSVLGAGGALVAADVFRLDVRNGAIALEVGGFPDVLPISRLVDTREGVYDSADLLIRLRLIGAGNRYVRSASNKKVLTMGLNTCDTQQGKGSNQLHLGKDD